METLILKLKTMHPLAFLAAVGVLLFVAGGVMHFATAVPYGLMWIGGGLVCIAGLISISAPA